MPEDYRSVLLIPAVIIALTVFSALTKLHGLLNLLALALMVMAGAAGLLLAYNRYSVQGRERKKRIAIFLDLPNCLTRSAPDAVMMGREVDLDVPIYLPDSIRSRHVHIIGATGSGKTESVILNFLKQDSARGFGSVVLDAKGDDSFLKELRSCMPEDRLKVFDLSDVNSLGYNPLEAGSALESAQRLFSSLTWSEEYYKSKALSVLQAIFELHRLKENANPRLIDVASYLQDPATFCAFMVSDAFPKAMAFKEFEDLSGLRDQIRSLCLAHLRRTLSPILNEGIDLNSASDGIIIYFRLQSLMSPQLVTTIGKLIINHLNFLAGTAHRRSSDLSVKKMVPVYFDEFASFACVEFADLISKARSAGFALHFSHQSNGDLIEVSEGFLSRITDNAATKIVMRVNDPDTADYFARSFGTELYRKATQRVTNAKNIDAAEVLEEGTIREAHQFRASPDLMKTLPTGAGAVLIAHGIDTPRGGSSVFKIRFPKLEGDSFDNRANASVKDAEISLIKSSAFSVPTKEKEDEYP